MREPGSCDRYYKASTLRCRYKVALETPTTLAMSETVVPPAS